MQPLFLRCVCTLRCERLESLFVCIRLEALWCICIRRLHPSKAKASLQVTGTVMTVALRRVALTPRRKKMLLKMGRSIRIKGMVKRTARVQRAHHLRKIDCFVVLTVSSLRCMLPESSPAACTL